MPGRDTMERPSLTLSTLALADQTWYTLVFLLFFGGGGNTVGFVYCYACCFCISFSEWHRTRQYYRNLRIPDTCPYSRDFQVPDTGSYFRDLRISDLSIFQGP